MSLCSSPLWSERRGDPGEAGDQRAPPLIIDGEEAYRFGRSGLPSPGPDTAVSSGLGGLRSGGTVLGQCRGHLGSFSHHRLPSWPPGEAGPQTPRKTPASFASSLQEPLTGGGALSRIQPLWLPPIATRGNPHLSFNFISHAPHTWDWFTAQVLPIDSCLFNMLSNSPQCEVLFLPCRQFRAFIPWLIPCYRPGLFTR